MTPQAVGPYRILRTLGEGGQGVVYLAQAPGGPPVAVKVLRDGVPADESFAKEVAAARRVEPFCIAQVLDASLGGRPYIVTEFVEGPSLQQAGRHAGADLQRLAVSTATALTAIHRAGVVHRDFKPANVLLGRDGPRVIDFGIAKATGTALTVTSSIVGTPSYMAPEQLVGAGIGPPTDVFAWASVMVFAATGTPPFGNDSMPAVLSRIQYGEPYLEGVPEPLRAIVASCFVKDPARRPTMQDVLFQLIGGSPPPRPQPTLPSRKNRTRPALVAGAVAVALTCATATTWLIVRPGSSTALATPTATTHATTTPTPTTKKPTPTRKPTKRPVKPTSEPSQARTTTAPTPTKTATATGRVSSVRVRYEGIRVGDCWRRDLNIYAKVTASGPFSYRWYVNGANQGMEMGKPSTEVLLPSITWNDEGQHRIILEVTTPARYRKSFTVNLCGAWDGW